MFDLRGNGGGLVEEARLIASMFIAHGTIVSTRGRTQPSETIAATGDPIAPTIPMVVLVDHNTASSSEIVTAALQDHHRATVVGTHTFGKGVFQEEEPLSNGGALDITVGEYFTPNGRNLGGGGVKQGAGITPEVPLADNVVDSPHGLDGGAETLAAKVKSELAPRIEGEEVGGQAGQVLRQAGQAGGEIGQGLGQADQVFRRLRREVWRRAPGTVVAVLEKRGRFWAAEPVFPRRAPTMAGATPARRGASRSAPIASPIVAGRQRAPGIWCSCGQARRGDGRRADHARAGAPRRRSRPDRGADARSRSRARVRGGGRARGARGRRAEDRGDGRPARPGSLPTFTIDPASARDFDDAISAERLRVGEPGRAADPPHPRRRACGFTSRTSAPTCPRARASIWRRRRRGDERLRAGRGRADAAAGAVERRLLARAGKERAAVTVELELHGGRGSRRPPSTAR